MNIQEICNALKVAREAKGLSYNAVETKTGISRKTAKRAETDAKLYLSTIINLSEIYDLELKIVSKEDNIYIINNVKEHLSKGDTLYYRTIVYKSADGSVGMNLQDDNLWAKTLDGLQWLADTVSGRKVKLIALL